MWHGQNLPWQYAPSCNLYVSPDLVVFQTTKSDGTASITVPVPNQANLAGVRFYNQFLITSPVNGFGMIATNAASAKIGEF